MNALRLFGVGVQLGAWTPHGQTQADVPPSLAWDVATDARHAALGGLDVAPLEADGWSVAVHPCALDSSVERDVYTSYLDYFAGIRSGAVTWPLAHRGDARRMWASGLPRTGRSKAPPLRSLDR